MTDEELIPLTREWQKILRVQDWDVSVELTGDERILGEGIDGLNDMNATLKSSHIHVRNPEVENRNLAPNDVEQTLVHELLHCHTNGFDNHTIRKLNKSQDLAMEVMVDKLAWALVTLKREKEEAYLRGKKDQISETIKLFKGRK